MAGDTIILVTRVRAASLKSINHSSDKILELKETMEIV